MRRAGSESTAWTNQCPRRRKPPRASHHGVIGTNMKVCVEVFFMPSDAYLLASQDISGV
jgi:hypothetical protein